MQDARKADEFSWISSFPRLTIFKQDSKGPELFRYATDPDLNELLRLAPKRVEGLLNGFHYHDVQKESKTMAWIKKSTNVLDLLNGHWTQNL